MGQHPIATCTESVLSMVLPIVIVPNHQLLPGVSGPSDSVFCIRQTKQEGNVNLLEWYGRLEQWIGFSTCAILNLYGPCISAWNLDYPD